MDWTINFFVKLREKKNIQDQVQTSIIDTDANSKENQVDAANTQNKLESETRPDEGNIHSVNV